MAERHGKGTIIKRGDGGTPENFVAVAQIGDVSGPNVSADVHDTTHQAAARSVANGGNGGWRTKIGGLKDGGQVTFQLKYDPAEVSHQQILEDLGTRRNWQIDTEEGDVCDFAAVVSEVGQEFPLEDLMGAEVTFEVSGAPVWTIAP